jgi:hypothetical protein
VVSQTTPDDVTDDARDAARLELACVRTWVKEEDTRESVRETTRFTHDGEAVIKPDVLETEVDIRTVAVPSRRWNSNRTGRPENGGRHPNCHGDVSRRRRQPRGGRA